MMKRRQHSAQFKAKVAMEALKGQKAVNELASEYWSPPPALPQGSHKGDPSCAYSRPLRGWHAVTPLLEPRRALS